MNRQVLCCVYLILYSVSGFGQSDTGCTIIKPSLYAESLNCSKKSVQVHIVAPQPNLSFSWKSADTKLGTIAPKVTRLGWYFVKSTLIGTSCTRLDSIYIHQNIDKPKAVAKIQTYQYANSFMFELDAHGSSKGEEFLYFWWSTSKEVSIEDENASFTMASMPGTYYLKVINKKNGCSSISSAKNVPLEQGLYIEK